MSTETVQTFTAEYAKKFAGWQAGSVRARAAWDRTGARPLYAQMAGYAYAVRDWNEAWLEEYGEKRRAFSGARGVEAYQDWRGEKGDEVGEKTAEWVEKVQERATALLPSARAEWVTWLAEKAEADPEEHEALYAKLSARYDDQRLLSFPMGLRWWAQSLTEGFRA